MNQLQAVALNEGLRSKKRLWREHGREQLESFRLAPWASRRRQDLLELLKASPLSKHPKLGDLAMVKMFETGFKRTGDIQPARISAEPKAGSIPQLYAKRLYLPEWRKGAIERIPRAEREESGTEFPTGDERLA
jgi:hypothetical protein